MSQTRRHQSKLTSDKFWQLILAWLGNPLFPYVGFRAKNGWFHHEVFPAARRWAALSLCPLGPMWARQRLGPTYGCWNFLTSKVVMFNPSLMLYQRRILKGLCTGIWYGQIWNKGCMNFGMLVLVNLCNYSWICTKIGYVLPEQSTSRHQQNLDTEAEILKLICRKTMMGKWLRLQIANISCKPSRSSLNSDRFMIHYEDDSSLTTANHLRFQGNWRSTCSWMQCCTETGPRFRNIVAQFSSPSLSSCWWLGYGDRRWRVMVLLIYECWLCGMLCGAF